jgi:predicted metalloendopeptidase
MRRHLVAFVFVSLPLAAAIGRTQSRTAVETGSLDRRVDPCIDFYQFACGGWIEKNPLPADRQNYGRIQEVQDRNFAVLRRLLETPGATGDSRKASDYYASCIGTAAIEAKGLRPLQPILARIDALKSRKELPELVGYLHRVAAEPPRRESVSGSACAFASSRSDPNDRSKAWVRADGLDLPVGHYRNRRAFGAGRRYRRNGGAEIRPGCARHSERRGARH